MNVVISSSESQKEIKKNTTLTFLATCTKLKEKKIHEWTFSKVKNLRQYV